MGGREERGEEREGEREGGGGRGRGGERGEERKEVVRREVVRMLNERTKQNMSNETDFSEAQSELEREREMYNATLQSIKEVSILDSLELLRESVSKKESEAKRSKEVLLAFAQERARNSSWYFQFLRERERYGLLSVSFFYSSLFERAKTLFLSIRSLAPLLSQLRAEPRTGGHRGDHCGVVENPHPILQSHDQGDGGEKGGSEREELFSSKIKQFEELLSLLFIFQFPLLLSSSLSLSLSSLPFPSLPFSSLSLPSPALSSPLHAEVLIRSFVRKSLFLLKETLSLSLSLSLPLQHPNFLFSLSTERNKHIEFELKKEKEKEKEKEFCSFSFSLFKFLLQLQFSVLHFNSVAISSAIFPIDSSAISPTVSFSSLRTHFFLIFVCLL